MNIHFFSKICLFITILISTTQAQDEEEPFCLCEFLWEPICASNGETYPNECRFLCYQKHIKDLEFVHKGKCKEQMESRSTRILEHAMATEKSNIPVLMTRTDNGTTLNIQNGTSNIEDSLLTEGKVDLTVPNRSRCDSTSSSSSSDSSTSSSSSFREDKETFSSLIASLTLSSISTLSVTLKLYFNLHLHIDQFCLNILIMSIIFFCKICLFITIPISITQGYDEPFCPCEKMWEEPLCASNGDFVLKTFPSECEFLCHQKIFKDLEFVHKGVCTKQ
uniref:Uncharacterized protein LOC114336395 n=1 Tax=Diabrotica virgifera virgifera TaxID=50390 RepID=A0A6P7GCG7_DIAVI